jgi:hypothetical protein
MNVLKTRHTRGAPWRWMWWGAAAALLMVPAIAMQFTREVNWSFADFAVFGLMLGSVGLGAEFLVRQSGSAPYRLGAAMALLASFLLVWINLAVGIIGDEGNPANLMFAGVLSVACGGAIIAHFRATGMARAMAAAAAAQGLVGAVALVGRLGEGSAIWPRDVLGATAMFVALWLVSAGLFRLAAARG